MSQQRTYPTREAAMAAQQRVLTQADVEQGLLDVQTRMEKATEEYAVLSDEVAEAESDWKYEYHKALVRQAANGGRTSADLREARAALEAGRDRFRRYRLAVERQKAGREYLETLRRRQDALRTIGSNIRAQT